MHDLRRAFYRLFSFLRAEPLDQELKHEIATHIEMAVEENLRRGLSEGEARRQALIQFGGVDQAHEQHHEARGLPWLDALAQDLRFSFRTLWRDRGFTFVAVSILA